MPIMVAEIGINHNGSLQMAFDLIKMAKRNGFNFVKFQKRNIYKCYTKEYLSSSRTSPWGNTQEDQKKGLEFSIGDFKAIDNFCKELEIGWFYSAWDVDSAKEMLDNFNCPFIKIARACNNNKELIEFYNKNNTRKNIIVSFNPYIDYLAEIKKIENIKYILACVSLYPAPDDYTGVEYLRENQFYNFGLGYSNHSPKWIFPVIARYLGAKMIEVHITLDKGLYGSDQSSSLDEQDIIEMMKYIKGIGKEKNILDYIAMEENVLKKLRQTW